MKGKSRHPVLREKSREEMGKERLDWIRKTHATVTEKACKRLKTVNRKRKKAPEVGFAGREGST